MSAQPDNQQMEGVQDPSTDIKGKGKAPEGEAMEESMDDDSSDESGVEDQVCFLALTATTTPGANTANMIAFSPVNVSHARELCARKSTN